MNVRAPLAVLAALLSLAWLWFRLLDHLRVEWTVNPQYNYGWAVPVLCLYLLWRRLQGTRLQDNETGKGSEKVRKCESGKVGSGEAAHSGGHTLPLTPLGSSSLFQRFSFLARGLFALLALAYLPTRLIEEANPEWRLVSWALALIVLGLTWLTLRSRCFGAATLKGPGGPGLPATGAGFAFFPLLFFLVAVPWPTIVEGPLVQGLARANTAVTVEILSLLSVPAVQHGNVIEVGTGVVGIDDACSGIRSFQATLMLSLFFGEIHRLSVRRRIGLCLLGFGLAFVFNVGRTTLLTCVAASQGVPAIANWHDPAGVTILVACFVFLWLAAVGLGKGEAAGPQDNETTGLPDNETTGLPDNETTGLPDDGTTGLPDDETTRLQASGGHVVASSCRPVVLWSRRLLSAFQHFNVSTFSAAPLLLLPWLLAVELGVEAWYRVHERRLPPAPAWTVALPRSNPSYRDLPLTEKTRQFLRYDEAQNGAWTEPDDLRVQAIYLRWNPGRIAVHLAKGHTPEVCLPAAGRQVNARSGLRRVPAQGLQLPFRAYTVQDEAGPLYVFYCLWEDRADAQDFDTTKLTYGNRLAPVRAGRRNAGQRSLEIILRGARDEAEAERKLQEVLEKVIAREKS